LGVGLRTVQRRENGAMPVTEEAWLALRMLAESAAFEWARQPVDPVKDKRHRSRQPDGIFSACKAHANLLLQREFPVREPELAEPQTQKRF
jgi:hypothetical protein